MKKKVPQHFKVYVMLSMNKTGCLNERTLKIKKKKSNNKKLASISLDSTQWIFQANFINFCRAACKYDWKTTACTLYIMVLFRVCISFSFPSSVFCRIWTLVRRIFQIIKWIYFYTKKHQRNCLAFAFVSTIFFFFLKVQNRIKIYK